MRLKILVVIVQISLLFMFSGCEKEAPRQVSVDPRLQKTKTITENPEQVIHRYINALREKNVDDFIDCHALAKRIEKDNADYDKLKDALKRLDVLEYKIVDIQLKHNKQEATVILDWKIQYLADKSEDNKIFDNKNFAIPLLKELGEWLVNPNADLSRWGDVKVSNQKVQDVEENK